MKTKILSKQKKMISQTLKLTINGPRQWWEPSLLENCPNCSICQFSYCELEYSYSSLFRFRLPKCSHSALNWDLVNTKSKQESPEKILQIEDIQRRWKKNVTEDLLFACCCLFWNVRPIWQVWLSDSSLDWESWLNS